MSLSCIDGETESEKEWSSPWSSREQRAGTGRQAWPLALPSVFPSPGSYFVSTLDESIRCLAAPSLQRLFQVLDGGVCKPRQLELTAPDPSWSGPRNSAGKYL